MGEMPPTGHTIASVSLKRLICVIGLALAAIAVSGCGGEDDGDEDGVFDRDGFSFTFEYPDGFAETEEVNTDFQLGSDAAANAAVAIAEEDAILIQEYELNVDVTDANLDLAQEEFDRLFGGLAGREPDAQQVEVAGLPALEYDGIEIPTREGAVSRFVAIFDGDREFLLNCQSTEAHRDDVESACDQAIETFEVK